MKSPLIGLVGPCAAGKTTLASLLNKSGFNAKPIAQEHSYVQNMWEQLTKPAFLIYLDVSFTTTLLRRPNFWTEEEFRDEVNRLKHAREHAYAIIKTDDLTPQEVYIVALTYLQVFISNP